MEEKGVLINGNYSDSNRNVEIRLGGGRENIRIRLIQFLETVSGGCTDQKRCFSFIKDDIADLIKRVLNPGYIKGQSQKVSSVICFVDKTRRYLGYYTECYRLH